MSTKIKILALVALFTISTTAFGTLLLDENFSYTVGTALTATGNWTAHSGGGTRPILVTTPGLTYAGYASSGIGEATTYSGGSSGEDINTTFSPQTSGSVYAAVMVNFSTATTTTDYFMHFGPQTIGSTYRAKVFVKQDGSNNVAIGLTKGVNTPVQITGYNYAFNTTYLLVIKYTFNTGSGTDDEVKLWMNPTIGGAEPPSDLTETDATQSDLTDCGSFALRQATQAYALQADGIRIGDSWADILPGGSITPTQLVITSINGGVAPSVNTPFSVMVQAQDGSGTPGNVTANTDIVLSLATGSGALGGILTGQIGAGTSTVTINNITYNTVEGGVSITATRTSGDILTPGTSAPFSVLAAASQLAFVNVPAAGQVGNAIGAFTVEARRPDNSVDLNYTDNVIIGKTSGPGGMTGTVMKYCVAGVATFNDIEFDASGSYEIGVTAAGLTGATSSSINILEITFPLIENFEYTIGTSLVYNGWSAHSAPGSNPVLVTTPGLTYTGYLSSGIGEAATINGSGEDVNRIFTAQTTGSVYAAFMLNVTSAPTSWDYFAHLGGQAIGTTFRPKLFVKADLSNNLSFGLSKGNNAPPIDSTPFSFALNTTYLIVLKYSMIDGAANDEVSMWINPSLTGSEPTADITVIDASSDLSNVGSFALRQGSSLLTAIVDGIRVGENWGIVNGSFPPSISDVSRTPSIPFDGDDVHVSAKIYDAVTTLSGILDTLYYAVNNQVSWTAVSKDSFHESDSMYYYTIPAVTMDAQGDTVFYSIAATDGDGNRATSSGFRYVIPLERSVAQIQGSSAASPDTHNYIHTSGIVTGVFGNRFFMEQRPGGAWNGTYVYRGVVDDDPPVIIGDSVDVVGVVAEYSTLTEINANASSLGAVAVMGNVALPCTTLLTIATLAEDYEGDLIKIDNLHFNVTGTFTQETNYWVVNNPGNESLRIRIDSTAFGIVGQAIPTTEIPVIGCLSQYKDTFQLFPRVMTDLSASYLDVGVMSVDNPTGTQYQGISVKPKITVKNFGTIATPSFPAIFTISEGKVGEYCDTITVPALTPSEELQVEFDPYPAPALGIFNTEAKTELPGDGFAGNDYMAGTGFEVIVAPVSNWAQMESVPIAYDVKMGKYVKDGGSMTVASDSKQADEIYAFYGNKSKLFRKYTPGAKGVWAEMESIPYGYKSTNLEKINKKTPKKGSALCWDGDNTIYAAKGGTNEFWAYYIDADTWVQKAFVPVPKKYKGGTSMVLYNDKLYFLAGGQKKTDPTNFYVYDPTADTLPLAVTSDAWASLTGAPLTPALTGKLKVWKDGSCIALMNNLVYALKGGDKHNFMYAYEFAGDTWTAKETIPYTHPQIGKKTKFKDGGAMTTTGSNLYAVKGGGKQDFWMYTPGDTIPWTPLETIPRLWKKSIPKTGAALVYADNYIWLQKGNNGLEFWRYGPVVAKTEGIQNVSSTYNAVMTGEAFSTSAINISVTPNPFTKYATVRYTVPVSGRVSLKLYSANGRLVQTLIDQYQNAGTYTLETGNWQSQVSNGVYFLRYENMVNRAELKLILE